MILYGRRRMGKSTVLRNLSYFLPERSVLVALVSMQEPPASESTSSLIGLLDKEIRNVCGERYVSRSIAPSANLGDFFRLLVQVDRALEAKKERLIIAIDEYEVIGEKIRNRAIDIDLLATIRASIQSHPRLTWLFAGSHEITELDGVDWTSYLISARTIEVRPFSLAETTALLTDPLRHSPVYRAQPAKRPKFDPSSWGDHGIDRIHSEAGGWPFFVQLISETAVKLLNREEDVSRNADLLDRAFELAVTEGRTTLQHLLETECRVPGEWEFLSAFRTKEIQPEPGEEDVRRSIRRRLLVIEEGGRWRLRVPLMRRWLQQHA